MIVAQLRLTLCNPMDCNLPGSSVRRILEARILEWVAIFFSKGSSLPRRLLSLLPWQVGSLPLVPPGKPSISVYWGLNFLRAKLVEPSSSHGLPWSSQGFTTQLPNDSEVPGTMLIKQNHMNIIK